MNEKKVTPKSDKIPIIGGSMLEDNEQAQAVVEGLQARINPMFEQIMLKIEALEMRVAVVEEVKKIFPDTINVIIKKEENDAWKNNIKEKK